jgi:hypothetical protein|tara:strand:- start:834 stop:1085 length:252 start_codon:yes stop_codon:yes gene_type:complete
MGTFIIKGTAVAGTLTNNSIGNSPFVRVVATAGTNTITVKDGATTLGTTLLHSAGDEITIEKHPKHTISSSAAVSATAVGVGH